MKPNFGPFSPAVEGILHGGDYNPDQWMKFYPETLEEDFRLMKLAGCNVMSVGIFAWAALEPEEGRYTFEWLDKVIDGLWQNGVYTILATPSGARPAWMAKKYPEVLRVDEMGVRALFGERHNHCLTSPVYRDRVKQMNTRLASRYRNHPGVILWHVSNEYSGECHCELCKAAFRDWLRERYHDSLDELNKAWWTAFWSHTFTSFEEINPPSRRGDSNLHGLNLDWRRFCSDQTIDFLKAEIAPLKEIAPQIPVTTNYMDFTQFPLDYYKMAKELDVVCWDNYPWWHNPAYGQDEEAARRAFIHDINRSFKGGKPFLLMESAPGPTNWQPVAKLLRPGMSALASMQAVAHGADTVQYFQWRKSLGSSEKFHAGVVDHYATERTRMFGEVAALGEDLKKLAGVIGTSADAKVAIIYDAQNHWALGDTKGPRAEHRDYFQTCVNHYKPFWDRGIAVDVIDSEAPVEGYDLVIAPMLYQVRKGVGEKLSRFVEGGGTLVTTYWSGIADDSDLCFTTGRPGPLRRVMGIWSEEIDALYDGETNPVLFAQNNLGIKGSFAADTLCDLVHLEGAEALATYQEDFYAGYPAVTVNRCGQGQAFYIACRTHDGMLDNFYQALAKQLKLPKALDANLPKGVTASLRGDEEHAYCFLQNFEGKEHRVNLKNAQYTDALTGEPVSGTVVMRPYSYRILEPVEGE